MKFVEFYGLTSSGEQETCGEVRLVNGALEFSDDWLKKFLEETAVYYGGQEYWPSDNDKEKYLSLLALAFSGSMFRASKVLER